MHGTVRHCWPGAQAAVQAAVGLASPSTLQAASFQLASSSSSAPSLPCCCSNSACRCFSWCTCWSRALCSASTCTGMGAAGCRCSVCGESRQQEMPRHGQTPMWAAAKRRGRPLSAYCGHCRSGEACTVPPPVKPRSSSNHPHSRWEPDTRGAPRAAWMPAWQRAPARHPHPQGVLASAQLPAPAAWWPAAPACSHWAGRACFSSNGQAGQLPTG